METEKAIYKVILKAVGCENQKTCFTEWFQVVILYRKHAKKIHRHGHVLINNKEKGQELI